MNKKTKRKASRRTKKRREFISSLLFFTITLLSISGLLTYLWVYNEINLTIMENNMLRKITVKIETENKNINSKITSLERIDRITNIAKNELKMVTPEPESLAVMLENIQLANFRMK